MNLTVGLFLAVIGTKSVTLDPTGTQVTYLIDVTNSDSSPVSAFVVDPVPATIVNVNAVALSGGGSVAVDHTTNSVSWTGIDVPANGTARLRITGGVRSGAPAGLQVSNQATIQFGDSAVATNAAVFTVPSREVRATLEKTQLTPAPVMAGSGAGNLVYRITLRTSPSNQRAANFVVSDTPASAADLTLDAATPSSGSWNAATRQWTTDWIPPGGQATLDVTMTAGSNAPSVVTNTASFDFGAFDFIAGPPATATTDIVHSEPESAPIPMLDAPALVMLGLLLAVTAAVSLRR